MKCLILAGGRGDRLWPLSRKDYPKQFIQIQKNHSIFQDTIARNIPYCDEFIIVTNYSYRYIIENQMQAFQGITYQCVYEEVGRKTTAAIILSCLRLVLSEIVLVVPSDHFITGAFYKENLLRAQELAKEGNIVLFGVEVPKNNGRMGYIRARGEEVLFYDDKPIPEVAEKYRFSGEYLANSGMFMFCTGDLFHELQINEPELFVACVRAFSQHEDVKGNLLFKQDVMLQVPKAAIGVSVFEKTDKLKVIQSEFSLQDIGSIEDIITAGMAARETGRQLRHHAEHTFVINQNPGGLVVVNGIDDAVVINTKDAVYVGKFGDSDELKAIIQDAKDLQPFFDKGSITYRPWGKFEKLVDESCYVVKKVMIEPGKTIYAHRHFLRNEHWTIVQGSARVLLDGVKRDYIVGEHIDIFCNISHQVSNIGREVLVIIEVATGSNVHEDDMISIPTRDLTEPELGIQIEPFIMLRPAFKDYLWGGTKMRDIYGKKCDFDVIAESWELSAHEAGHSIVNSGRHRGMAFKEYLELVGKEYWGWKCQSMQKFPILVKFIDARSNLSIQVHPDDEYALKVENEYGKNEMWYILDCEEGAGIYCGFTRDVTALEVRERIENNTIAEILNWIPVKKGDIYFIKAGTVHAVGAGCLLCEIQQNSDCTYRLYDYDRKDKYGNKRELHIDKALDVIDYSKYVRPQMESEVDNCEAYTAATLSNCKYFKSKYFNIKQKVEIEVNEESFLSILCVNGSGIIEKSGEKLPCKAGDSFFFPAIEGDVTIFGETEMIMTRV